MKLIKSEKLPQYSIAPVEQWEKECKRLYEEAEANKKVTTVKQQGYLIEYPVGTKDKVEEVDLPLWAKKLLPINELIKAESPWGEIEISPCAWEEEKIEMEAVVLPPKPEPIQGFNFNRPSEVADLYNQVFEVSKKGGESWTWGDIPSPKDGCYTIERWSEEVVEAGESYPTSWAVDGTAQEVIFKHYVLKVFPDRWELYETTRTATIYAGGWSGAVFGDSTSRDCDGFMNK